MPSIEDRLALLEKKEEEIVTLRANKIPYFLELQLKKNKLRLKCIEGEQRHTFQRICRKDGIHKEDWEDEFAMYWMGFLKGEYKSINEYLKRKKNLI